MWRSPPWRRHGFKTNRRGAPSERVATTGSSPSSGSSSAWNPMLSLPSRYRFTSTWLKRTPVRSRTRHRRRSTAGVKERARGSGRVAVAEIAGPGNEPGLEDTPAEEHDLALLPGELMAEGLEERIGLGPGDSRRVVFAIQALVSECDAHARTGQSYQGRCCAPIVPPSRSAWVQSRGRLLDRFPRSTQSAARCARSCPARRPPRIPAP